MANVIPSPNMSLPVPVPGIDPGPDYANNLNQSLNIIDSHNHTPGSGVQITPLGLNINSNLNFQNNQLINVFGMAFSSPASSTQKTFLYTNSATGGGIVDLFYNDGAGTIIPITKAGAVNSVASSIPGESYAGGTFTWKQGSASTTPANFDIGGVIIRPAIAGTSFGVNISPPSAISSQYNLVLPALPSAQNIVTLDASGNLVANWNVDNSTIVVSSNQLQVPSHGIQQTNLQTRTSVGATAAVGQIAISSDSANFSVNSTVTGFTQVTNLSVTITTSGRPVVLMLNGAPGFNAFIALQGTLILNGVKGVGGIIQALRGSTQVYNNILEWTNTNTNVGTPLTVSWPAGITLALDPVAAGTYTYTVQVLVIPPNPADSLTTFYVERCQLVAYEI